MNEFLAILARIGGDNPPSLQELTSARDGIARELHRLRREGATDLAALTSLRDAYKASELAVVEAEKTVAEVEAELDQALSDVPDPDSTDTEDTSDTDTDEAAVTASALPLMEAIRRLGLSQPAPALPAAPDLSTTRTTITLADRDVENATFTDMARAFATATNRSGRAGKERLVSIRTDFAGDRTLSAHTGNDTTLLEAFVSPEAITAAGGCCSLPEPIRANPVEGSTARPIRDSLNSLGARAGQFTFYPAICDVDGVGLWTCEQDAAVDPDDPTTWKDCAVSECDDPITVGVEAIYTCRTVGNYKAKFAPEQWRAELQKLAVQQARVAERELFAKMRAGVTTTHTLSDTGSVYATLLQGAALAAAAIRQDQRLGNIRINWVLPEWVQLAVWSDTVARRISCADDPAFTTNQLTQDLAKINVRPVWSQDIDPLEEDSPGQVDGPLTPFPAVAHSTFAPDGYFTFLDGGQLDFGTEIRDLDLMRQNSLAAFSESFEGLLARGCNAKGLDIPVTVCDSAPCPA